MKLQHIVVASDLSEASRQAQRHAARLARCSGGRVTVLHVDEFSQYGFRSTDEMNCYLDQASDARANLLNDTRKTMRRFEINAKIALVSGEPVEQILDYVRREEADLLIMARRGLRGIKRLIMGGTVKRVLRRTPIPTVVLPADAREPELPFEPVCYERIICSTDFSQSSRRGLYAALDLASLIDAHVEQVHVLKLPVALPAMPGEAPIVVQRTSRDQIRHILLDNLNEILGEAFAQRCTPSVVTGTNVAHSLNEAAESMGADMICIPSRSVSGVSAALFGSTAESMLKVATVPVLVFPARYLAEHYAEPTLRAVETEVAEVEPEELVPEELVPTAPYPVEDPALERLLTSELPPVPQHPTERAAKGRQARRHVVHWRNHEGLERVAVDRRRELRLPVDFLANHYIEGVPHICRITDVSRNGARVDRMGGPLSSAPESETSVELELRLPGQSDTTYLTGQVTHRTDSSFGIRLSESADEYQRRYVRYIDHTIASMPMT